MFGNNLVNITNQLYFQNLLTVDALFIRHYSHQTIITALVL